MAFPPLDFIDEDDLQTFEGWLKYQAINPSELSEAEMVAWQECYDESRKVRDSTPKIGRMNLKRPGDSTYAVAIRDRSDLWLALWVKRSRKPEYFIFHPTTDGNWNPHSSLHADGTFHMKSHDRKMITQQRQPPASLKGTEHLGAYGGFGPKSVGAVCDPADFSGVFEAPPRVLGPRNGTVTVDLIDPDSDMQPHLHPGEEVGRRLFTDSVPNVLIRLFR
jgi:hypothetical protein